MSLKLGIIGNGRMGAQVAKLAPGRGHQITAVYGRQNPIAVGSEIKNVDVLIDFSLPDATLCNVTTAIRANLPIVIGTTGWHHLLDEVRSRIEASNSALLYAANFSIGMNLFSRIVHLAAQLFNPMDQYDIHLHEAHHRGKRDHPSGTALKLAQQILDQVDRKTEMVSGNPEGPILAHQLHITSLRSGHIPGTHSLGFDGPADQITITHSARNREGFALGSIQGAEWLADKRGFFCLDDMLSDFLSQKAKNTH